MPKGCNPSAHKVYKRGAPQTIQNINRKNVWWNLAMLYVTEKKVYLHFFLLVNYMHQMGFESKTSPSFHESNEELPFEPGIFVVIFSIMKWQSE